ncbi:hypothetical protein CONPUDRAFT_166269 [Coniophora puteana RWD-64-598 SS2]|uniref:RTA1-domain-containing protein n=1 Tax=Coniophora puteana (strain RWD-64-598) TaxID=741705 RepID=A0A5M3MJX2_CONPW|nr:uncharacterized protein CONPUDRAFT_166269 [Coniophora puteana RWD-64-598 SS2]EIW79512.1 hypothetical protein CONPUDRAFT_166269 [Coniophora puteana RWD-64-598 SS2]
MFLTLQRKRFLPFVLSTLALFSQSVNADSSNSTTSSDVPTLVERVYHYSPSKPTAIVAGVLYAIAASLIFVRLCRARSWWGLCLPIAAALMSIGFFLRIPMALNPNSLGVFMIQDMFIILSPAAFLAFNYMLYGRLVSRCIDPKHSWVQPRKVARIFVTSDVVTFLIQGGGGGLQASKSSSSITLGARVLLVGLILQTLSFAFFIVLVIHAHRSLRNEKIKASDHLWGMLFKLLYFTSFFFLLRCVYRTIEYGQAEDGTGYLQNHEVFFYVLDSLALLVGISAYIRFWPDNYLPKFPTSFSQVPLNELA